MGCEFQLRCRYAVVWQQLAQDLRNLPNGRFTLGCNLKYLSGYIGLPGREKRCRDQIIDIDEIARLISISVDCQRPFFSRIADEFCNDAALVRRARAVDVAETQRDRLDAERARVGGTISLASQFACAVRRNGPRSQFFVNGRRDLPERGAAGREDEPFCPT